MHACAFMPKKTFLITKYMCVHAHTYMHTQAYKGGCYQRSIELDVSTLSIANISDTQHAHRQEHMWPAHPHTSPSSFASFFQCSLFCAMFTITAGIGRKSVQSGRRHGLLQDRHARTSTHANMQNHMHTYVRTQVTMPKCPRKPWVHAHTHVRTHTHTTMHRVIKSMRVWVCTPHFHSLFHAWYSSKMKKSINWAYKQHRQVRRVMNIQSRRHYQGKRMCANMTFVNRHYIGVRWHTVLTVLPVVVLEHYCDCCCSLQECHQCILGSQWQHWLQSTPTHLGLRQVASTSFKSW